MTTIAVNRSELAADSQLNGGIPTSARKVWKYKGYCIGACGTYTEIIRFVEWFKHTATKPKPRMKDITALVLTPDGKILCYDMSTTPYEIHNKYTAIGSGAQAAMLAMYLGHSPAEAVRLASKVDSDTGGRVHIRRRT